MLKPLQWGRQGETLLMLRAQLQSQPVSLRPHMTEGLEPVHTLRSVSTACARNADLYGVPWPGCDCGALAYASTPSTVHIVW